MYNAAAGWLVRYRNNFKDKPMYLGIDPGQTGGLALLSAGGDILRLEKFDHKDSAMIVKSVVQSLPAARIPGGLVIGVELVHAMPGQGVSSMFTFGLGLGRIHGVLIGLTEAWTNVSPQAWQRYLPESEAPKGRIMAFAAERWGPHLFILPGCRVPHAGALDAAGIAEYMRRVTIGELQAPATKAKTTKLRELKLGA
jgi:crossover junction endodeoxyribonuclease RuvC